MKIDINNVPNYLSEALSNLNYSLDEYDLNRTVFINLDKAKARYESELALMHQLKLVILNYVYEETGKLIDLNFNSPKDREYLFLNILKYPRDLFIRDGKLSFSGEVITSLPSDFKNIVTHTLLEYIEAQSKSTNIKPYSNLNYAEPPIYNNEGDRLAVIKPRYRPSDTLRNQSYEPNIQGLGKENADLVTAPEGYVVVQVDSRQIEPCIYYSTFVKDPMINWLIQQYGDVYYALTDYCLRESIEFTPSNLYVLKNQINPSERDTLKTLVNAGTYGSSKQKVRNLAVGMFRNTYLESEEGFLLKELLYDKNNLIRTLGNPRVPMKFKHEASQKLNYIETKLNEINQNIDRLVDFFFSRVIGHPQRVSAEREIDKKIRMGDRVLTSPFGDEREVYGHIAHLKNCFINNPIQIAVSRLSAISIKLAFDYINSSKENKNKLFFAFHKHDEDVFYVRMDAIEEVAPVLADLRSYEIEGWIPIHSELKIGLDYVK